MYFQCCILMRRHWDATGHHTELQKNSRDFQEVCIDLRAKNKFPAFSYSIKPETYLLIWLTWCVCWCHCRRRFSYYEHWLLRQLNTVAFCVLCSMVQHIAWTSVRSASLPNRRAYKVQTSHGGRREDLDPLTEIGRMSRMWPLLWKNNFIVEAWKD